jgi:rod shape-determining protein MreD
MIILLLPLNIPKWLLLIIGFITGITIDMFSNTIGMHAAATVFMAFFRPIILNFVLDKDEFENIISPNMNEFGIKRFLTYTTFLVLIHHTVLFITETFRFTELFFTLITIILSSIFTIFLIVMSQYITKKAKKERTNIKKIQF